MASPDAVFVVHGHEAKYPGERSPRAVERERFLAAAEAAVPVREAGYEDVYLVSGERSGDTVERLDSEFPDLAAEMDMVTLQGGSRTETEVEAAYDRIRAMEPDVVYAATSAQHIERVSGQWTNQYRVGEDDFQLSMAVAPRGYLQDQHKQPLVLEHGPFGPLRDAGWELVHKYRDGELDSEALADIADLVSLVGDMDSTDRQRLQSWLADATGRVRPRQEGPL